MPLPGDDGAHAALVVPSRDHDQLAYVELDEVLDLPGLNVEHDCVIDLRSTCTALTDQTPQADSHSPYESMAHAYMMPVTDAAKIVSVGHGQGDARRQDRCWTAVTVSRGQGSKAVHVLEPQGMGDERSSTLMSGSG